MKVRKVFGSTAACALALGMAGVLPAVATAAPAATAGPTQTYLVLYKQNAVPADAAASVGRAGGALVASYPQIGVVVARSDSTAFRSKITADGRVQGASATTGMATRLDPAASAVDSAAAVIDPGTPAPGSDSLSGLQWDMAQINAPEAHAINGGSRVSPGRRHRHRPGLHPPGPRRQRRRRGQRELRQRRSGAGHGRGEGRQRPRHPHRRHDRRGQPTASASSASRRTCKIAGIKAGNADGFFFPEAGRLRVHVGRPARHPR